MKLVLYSAIYGNYEATAKPLPPDLPCPAVMFTDREDLADQARSIGWIVVETSYPYSRFDASDGRNGDPAVVTPMLAHKYWKTHPAEVAEFVAAKMGPRIEADASIWIDGNMRIELPGPDWVARNLEALGDDEWSLMKHPWRSCIYDEEAYTSAVCWGRYSVEAMQRQVAAYRDERAAHPEGWGLFASGHMVRRHTETVREICEDWWQHNLAFSHQDQLSLPFLIRKYEICPDDRYRPRWNANLPWGLWALDPHGT